MIVVCGLVLAGCVIPVTQMPSPTAASTHYLSFDDIATLGAQAAMTQTARALGTLSPEDLTAVSSTQTAVHTPLALRVILPDGSYSNFTSQSIETLATLSLGLFDQLRPAVDLLHLLKQAGWQHHYLYSVTIEGRGSLTLQVDHLPGDAALYLDQGTLNFVSGEIPVDDWPRDVVLIIVR